MLPLTARLVLMRFAVPQASFLEQFGALQPDLAVTVAYGNMLPSAFLSIPHHGTLNIHPSLLPKYRGAAPVQRAVEVCARMPPKPPLLPYEACSRLSGALPLILLCIDQGATL